MRASRVAGPRRGAWSAPEPASERKFKSGRQALAVQRGPRRGAVLEAHCSGRAHTDGRVAPYLIDTPHSCMTAGPGGVGHGNLFACVCMVAGRECKRARIRGVIQTSAALRPCCCRGCAADQQSGLDCLQPGLDRQILSDVLRHLQPQRYNSQTRQVILGETHPPRITLHMTSGGRRPCATVP